MLCIESVLTDPPKLLPFGLGVEPEGTERSYETGTFRLGRDCNLPEFVFTTETVLPLLEDRLELPAKPK